MRRKPSRIGLAIVGAGRVGLFRGDVAARHGAVDWIGIAEKNPDRAREVAAKILRMDFDIPPPWAASDRAAKIKNDLA